MKTISPFDLGLIEIGLQRSRKHNMHMAMIETIRGQDLDDAIIVCDNRKQSFHTWKFMRNQLQSYKVTRMYDNGWIVLIERYDAERASEEKEAQDKV